MSRNLGRHIGKLSVTLSLALSLVLCLGASHAEGAGKGAPAKPKSIAQLAPHKDGQLVVTGERQGALYAMYMPAVWNGDLVLYAHGYLSPDRPIALPIVAWIRNLLLEDGYAVAYSSYSKNGWAVREGFKETEDLLPLFRSRFGPPSSVYVIGHSMGGLISVMLAELHPGKYDGVLPICGAIGGAVMTFDYFTDVRVLFDAYYPGVIPGGALDIPEGIDPLFDAFGPAALAVHFDASPATEMSAVEELGLYWTNVGELAVSTATGLHFNVMTTGDLMDRCRGSFFENTEGYSHPSPPVFDPPILDEVTLNGMVEHHTMDRNCHAYLKNWYEPDGKLRIPVLTLHESRDNIIPIKHESEYASRVAAQGRSEWLVQRTKDAYGHCGNFSAVEVKEAFDELVLWAEQGVRPEP